MTKTSLVADDELRNPDTSVRRKQYGGFYDLANATPGPATSWDPKVVEAYERRQTQLGKPGVWRHNPHGLEWKKRNGSFRDPDYYIVEW